MSLLSWFLRDHTTPNPPANAELRSLLAEAKIELAKLHRLPQQDPNGPDLLTEFLSRIDTALHDGYEPADRLGFVLMQDFGLDSIDSCELVDEFEKRIAEKQKL
jgi:hypothetical protein